MNASRKAPAKNPGRRSYRRLVTACLVLGSLLVMVALVILDRCFPLPLDGRPVSTVVTDRNQIPLRAFADARGVWRFPARPDQVSPLYLEALLAYEDQWFYSHPGVNPLAIMRATVQNLRAGRVVSGGSTITMQVARILDRNPLAPRTRSIGAKIRQMLRAIQLECHLTKDEILGLYLTHAPFGANIEGVRAAAYVWLGKEASDLTHAEAAMLAVLPQAPSRYRPDRHPEKAAMARDKVLDRMAAFEVWPAAEVRAAREEPVIPFRMPSPMTAPLASRRLRMLTPGSGTIDTFLDHEFQIHVEALLRDYTAGLPPRQSGAVLVVDGRSLETLAYAGSADFTDRARHGHVDMITALRSPGSTLKPFVYGLAMDAGLVHSHSMLLDVPRFGQSYDPGNFSRGFSGPVSLSRALQDSLNLPAVQVLEIYGPVRFHDRLKHAGARFRFAGRPNLSMALGGAGTSLESLVTLYTALARGGIAGRPRLTPSEPTHERYLMSPGAAWIVRKILSRPLPGQEGIARLAGDWPVAWKTGTSYGFRDAWAVGIKGDFVVGVWMGRPDGSPSPGRYGGVTALPLMARVMESLDPERHRESPPASVSRETVCWPSGQAESRIRGRAAGACARRHRAWILDQAVPPTLTGEAGLSAPLVKTVWTDRDGRRAAPGCGGINKSAFVLWPWQAEPFIPEGWRRSRMIPEDSDLCPEMAPVALPRIRIVSVSDRSVLSRQPGSGKNPSIPLKALGGKGRLHWFLNQKSLGPGSTLPMPDPGAYQLAVVDETGNFDQVRFRVIAPAP